VKSDVNNESTWEAGNHRGIPFLALIIVSVVLFVSSVLIVSTHVVSSHRPFHRSKALQTVLPHTLAWPVG
jgi:hypothetical protein